MLELKDICKTYKVGDIETKALDHISVAFRQKEFVAILGTSGSGKTTCLNIIGGLDQYTSGDLIINGKSTKNFRDRESPPPLPGKPSFLSRGRSGGFAGCGRRGSGVFIRRGGSLLRQVGVNAAHRGGVT